MTMKQRRWRWQKGALIEAARVGRTEFESRLAESVKSWCEVAAHREGPYRARVQEYIAKVEEVSAELKKNEIEFAEPVCKWAVEVLSYGWEFVELTWLAGAYGSVSGTLHFSLASDISQLLSGIYNREDVLTDPRSDRCGSPNGCDTSKFRRAWQGQIEVWRRLIKRKAGHFGTIVYEIYDRAHRILEACGTTHWKENKASLLFLLDGCGRGVEQLRSAAIQLIRQSADD